MYIFLHLPKTGGSTVRETLRRILKDKIYSFAFNGELHKYDRAFELEYLKFIPNNTEIFFGHYIVSDFPDEYLGCFMTMFRHPVERVISNYLHEIRHGTYIGELEEYICDYKRSYGKRKVCVNMYQSAIEDIKNLNWFAYVGIMEYFDSSMQLLAKKLKIDYNKSDLTLSTLNPNKEIGEKYQVAGYIKQKICEVNQADFEIYNHALELFNKDCIKYGIEIKENENG